jgi:hypothetical protein
VKPTTEEKIEARRRLVSMAKRASKVLELDPREWARGVRRSAPHLVEIVGHEEFQHIVKWAWSLP